MKSRRFKNETTNKNVLGCMSEKKLLFSFKLA